MKNFEIERKFLLDINNIPYDFSTLDKKQIEQGYILQKPEIRIRAIKDSGYFMTIKDNTEDDMVRKEVELPISKEAYFTLISREDVFKLRKNRYTVKDNNNKFEIDIFEGNLAGLACLEVEFSDKEEAESFLVPAWVKKEVTNDKRYRSYYLAKNNIPTKVLLGE